jgi:hypothetical protein
MIETSESYEESKEINRLHYFLSGTSDLYLFNLSTNLGEKISLLSLGEDKRIKGIPYHYDSIEVDSRIYLIGGQVGQYDIIYLATTFTYNPITQSLIPKSSMKHEKRHHTIISLKEISKNYIFSIGGENSHGYIRYCEKYDIETDEWTQIPSLKERKGKLSVCQFNNQFLYAFGGMSADFLETIEHYDTQSTNGWSKLIPIDKALWTNRCGSISLQFDEDNIIVFGGKDIRTKNEVFLFNVKEAKFEMLEKMKMADYFCTRKPFVEGGVIYSIGLIGNDIHMFHKDALHWETIERKTWHPTQYSQ